jgi:hypothetical protein
MERLCMLVKRNILAVHAIKVYGRKGDIPPLILNLGTIWGGSDQLHIPTTLSPVKEFVVPVD